VLYAQTLTLASNVKKPQIGTILLPGKSFYSSVLKNAHLVLILILIMNVCLVMVVLNAPVHYLLIVLAVIDSGDKI